MRKLKQISATTLAAISMAATLVSPAFAETTGVTETQTINSATSGSATVTYTQESSFTVSIPKKIELDGTTKSAEYTVKVKGDISNNEKVTVAPNSTFNLSDSHGKADVEATVTQTTQDFMPSGINSENGAETTGEISATALTAGDWTGQLNFDIALNENSASSTN